MTIDDVRAEARRTWGDKPITVEHLAIALGVVCGDVCRQARAKMERGEYSEAELRKELGNLIASAVRWCDDLGFDPKECIRLAQAAQKQYIKH